jgi:PIN domain nuclease of toxin-antitoxin system
MKFLLDTHVLLWWLDDPELLSDEARRAIANGRSSVYVSPISFLEIAIKEAGGKLTVPADIAGSLELCRFTELPLTVAHASAVRDLPPHHKDPFDRVLIAQARIEGLTLISRDSMIPKYDVRCVAA